MRTQDTYQEIQDRLIARNPIPYALTDENADSITIRASKGGANPLHDAAQRSFERKDTGTAPTYANAVHSLATRITDRHVRQARMRCDHLHDELVTESKSAIGEFLAIRVSRFPILASDLIARFACNALPATTVRALHKCARRACDARMARMGGKSKLVDPSFFNLFCDESAERSSELDTVFVNARIDYLLGLVRVKGSLNRNANRAAQAHAKLLEQARSYLLASIAGNAVSLPSAGLVPINVPVGFNVSETFTGTKPLPNKRIATSSYAVNESRGTHLAPTALYKRIARLASFVGATDIAESLGATNTVRGTQSRSTAWRAKQLAKTRG